MHVIFFPLCREKGAHGVVLNKSIKMLWTNLKFYKCRSNFKVNFTRTKKGLLQELNEQKVIVFQNKVKL
jgi:two-component SAPR family response regulator